MTEAKDHYGKAIHKGMKCRWHDPEGESDGSIVYEVYEEPDLDGCYPEEAIIRLASLYGDVEAYPHECEVV